MEYKIPFVGYKLQYKNLKSEIDGAIQDLLQRGDLILRRDVEEFEKNLADFVGTKYAISLNSCSDALIFSLIASGINPGDEVITVSHTFFSTIEAIHHVSALPVLVDVKDDFLINVNEIEKVITSKTRAIIPVHLNGRVCQMDKLLEIAQNHNLIIIEDAAQALGAEFNGKRAGSFGKAGCFSFYPAKVLGTLGDGGAVVTNDEKIAKKIHLLRNHGQETKTKIACYGFTSRLDNLQAAVLNVKFKYLEEWIKARRQIAQVYNKGLGQISEIKIPLNSDEHHFDVFQNYVLRAKKRDQLFDFLKNKGVETLIKDPVPNHWQKELGLSHFNLPYTEHLAKEVISLPLYPELTNKQVEYVIKSVKEFY